MESQEHNTLERSIGRVEGQLSSLVTAVASLSGNINALSSDFATMEKGRLTNLEVKFATLKTEMELKAKNSAVWYSAVISIAVSVGSGIIIYFLTH